MSGPGPVIFNPAGQVREVRLEEALVLAGRHYGIKLPSKGSSRIETVPRRNIAR